MVHPDIKSETVHFPITMIRKKGLFDLSKLYSAATSWYGENGYDMTEKDTTAKKVSPVKQGKFILLGERKVDDYFKLVLEVEIWYLETVDVKVKDKRLQKTRLEIRVKPRYVKNYKKTFKIEWMRRIYEQYFIKYKIDRMEGQLYRDVHSLTTAIKEILDLMQQ